MMGPHEGAGEGVGAAEGEMQLSPLPQMVPCPWESLTACSQLAAQGQGLLDCSRDGEVVGGSLEEQNVPGWRLVEPQPWNVLAWELVLEVEQETSPSHVPLLLALVHSPFHDLPFVLCEQQVPVAMETSLAQFLLAWEEVVLLSSASLVQVPQPVAGAVRWLTG